MLLRLIPHPILSLSLVRATCFSASSSASSSP